MSGIPVLAPDYRLQAILNGQDFVDIDLLQVRGQLVHIVERPQRTVLAAFFEEVHLYVKAVQPVEVNGIAGAFPLAQGHTIFHH